MKTYFITRENAGRHHRQLIQLHRLRHDIFIKAIGRPDLHALKALEYDFWDTLLVNAVNVLLCDEDDTPIGVARLVSSEEMTMLETDQAEFLWHPHDKRPDLWEIQRLGVRLDMPPAKVERAILFLLSEIASWCLANDIRDVMLLTYTGIAEKRLTEMTPLGPERDLVGAPHIALIGRLKPRSIADWMARYEALTPPVSAAKVA